MAARWTGGTVICAGRLREPGTTYDDIPQDVIDRGLAEPIADDPISTPKRVRATED